MMKNKFYSETEMINKIERIKRLIDESNFILIGAGAGLSTAAGVEYSGKRFTDNFSDFIDKYGFTDMYTSGFYDFKTQEEKWAYWAKHMYTNDVGMNATELYKNILKLVQNKDYFILTTNVDDQFFKAGVNKDRIFATQGSYAKIQCSKACHNKLYDASDLIKEMVEKTEKCKIPSNLVPVCPVCGEPMETNLRKDAFFVQDEEWYRENDNYNEFLNKIEGKKVLLLEFGVGFNTPGIIRFPFERLVEENENYNLVRFNKDNCTTYFDIEDRTIKVDEDINEVIEELIYR